jgi:hypothetical protein
MQHFLWSKQSKTWRLFKTLRWNLTNLVRMYLLKMVMIMIIIIITTFCFYLQLQTIKQLRLEYDSILHLSTRKFSTLTYELNCIPLLEQYINLTYNISSSRFLELEVCGIRTLVLWVIPETRCLIRLYIKLRSHVQSNSGLRNPQR